MYSCDSNHYYNHPFLPLESLEATGVGKRRYAEAQLLEDSSPFLFLVENFRTADNCRESDESHDHGNTHSEADNVEALQDIQRATARLAVWGTLSSKRTLRGKSEPAVRLRYRPIHLPGKVQSIRRETKQERQVQSDASSIPVLRPARAEKLIRDCRVILEAILQGHALPAPWKEIEDGLRQPNPSREVRIILLRKFRAVVQRLRYDSVNDLILCQRFGLAELQLRGIALIGSSLKNLSGKSFPEVIHSLTDRTFLERFGLVEDFEAYRREAMTMVTFDDPLKEIDALVESFAQHLTLDPEHVAVYKDLFRRMRAQSYSVFRVRREHPDDRELFQWCFGREALGNVQVIHGPTSLHFRIEDIDDWIFAYSGKTADELAEKEGMRAMRSKGAALNDNDRLPLALRDAVTIEDNTAKMPFVWTYMEVYAHEEQHVTQRFYDHIPMDFTWEISQFSSEASSEELVRCIVRNVRVCRQRIADIGAKDEILSYLRHEDRTHAEAVLRVREIEGRLYDYLADIRSMFTFSLSGVPFLRGKIDHVLGSEYENVIAQAFDAIESLQRAGADIPSIIEILRTEPLVRWGRLARRICERAKCPSSKPIE